MTIYFTNRISQMLGVASTGLSDCCQISDEKLTVDLKSGSSTIEFDIPENEGLSTEGNFILFEYLGNRYVMEIINVDEEDGIAHIYAEGAGLSLLNSICAPYEAEVTHAASYYINDAISGSGFEIGLNEVSELSRKLKWEGETTAAERCLSVANSFGAELSYSFEIDGMTVTHKYINLHKRRGKSIGMQLRTGFEILSISRSVTLTELATALKPSGGIPEGSETPIDISGLTYDDGDIHIEGSLLRSRTAFDKWRSFCGSESGDIVKIYSFETLDKQELLTRSISELKQVKNAKEEYSIDTRPDLKNIDIGDTIYAIDTKKSKRIKGRITKIIYSSSGTKYTLEQEV